MSTHVGCGSTYSSKNRLSSGHCILSTRPDSGPLTEGRWQDSQRSEGKMRGKRATSRVATDTLNHVQLRFERRLT
jgi:hypothetical protein